MKTRKEEGQRKKMRGKKGRKKRKKRRKLGGKEEKGWERKGKKE